MSCIRVETDYFSLAEIVSGAGEVDGTLLMGVDFYDATSSGAIAQGTMFLDRQNLLNPVSETGLTVIVNDIPDATAFIHVRLQQNVSMGSTNGQPITARFVGGGGVDDVFMSITTAEPNLDLNYTAPDFPLGATELWDVNSDDVSMPAGPLSSPGAAIAVGALDPDPNCLPFCQESAWVVDDRSSASDTRYRYELKPTVQEVEQGVDQGWTLKTRLRVASDEDAQAGLEDPVDAAIIVEYSEGENRRRNWQCADKEFKLDFRYHRYRRF